MEVKQWITVHPNGNGTKGQPIPVMEGQSKGEAVKAFVGKHKKEVDVLKNLSVDEIKAKAKKNTENKQADNGRFEIEDKKMEKNIAFIKKMGNTMRTIMKATVVKAKKLAPMKLQKMNMSQHNLRKQWTLWGLTTMVGIMRMRAIMGTLQFPLTMPKTKIRRSKNCIV